LKRVKQERYNVAGGYEQRNIDTIHKIIKLYFDNPYIQNINDYIDFSSNRPGQDLRYALDDTKLRSLGWYPTAIFDLELPSIVSYYKNKFIW
jgi:dTDP-glucose 4,6-dehydratase